MAKGQHYLWSNLYDGGESATVRTPNGGERNVISSRNIKTVGEEISESDASSKEEWEAWLEAGVARPYKYPDMPAGSTDSPVVHLQKQLAEAASSQEELLTAQVAGVTSSEEQMVEATSEAKPAAADKK
jgi:hypothetical protein